MNTQPATVTCDECNTEIDLSGQKLSRTFDRKGDYQSLCCPLCKAHINILVKTRKL